jgi:hypothetical protein
MGAAGDLSGAEAVGVADLCLQSEQGRLHGGDEVEHRDVQRLAVRLTTADPAAGRRPQRPHQQPMQAGVVVGEGAQPQGKAVPRIGC